MAMVDYRLCDVCGNKVFYDANLNYESGLVGNVPYRVAGKEQYDDTELLMNHGMCLDYLGDWAVICNDCATRYRTQIVII
jgi:hypothetical protein